MKITEEENDKFSLEDELFEPLNPYPGKYSKEYISKYLKHIKSKSIIVIEINKIKLVLLMIFLWKPFKLQKKTMWPTRMTRTPQPLQTAF